MNGGVNIQIGIMKRRLTQQEKQPHFLQIHTSGQKVVLQFLDHYLKRKILKSAIIYKR